MIRSIAIIYVTLFIIGLIFMPHAAAAFYAGKTSVSYFGLGLVTAGLVILISIISSSFVVIKRLEEEFQSLLGNLKTGEIVIIALLSGIAEETFFRGLLQPHIGIIIASVVFGLLHFPVKPHFIPWTIFAIIMGFVLGYLYNYTGGNLIAPITAHVVVNLINLWRISKRI